MSRRSEAGPSQPAGRMSLPQRSTRGKRMQTAMADDEADDQFWNQEFFAEEEQDIDYLTEDEEEDVPDSDFDEPESDEGEDEEGRDEDERPKRKALKAPEPKAPPKPKALKPKPKEPSPSEEGSEPPKKKQAVEEQPVIPIEYAAPTLRRSTMARVAQAESRRQEQVKAQVARPQPKKGSARTLTQAELLAEAARTEIDNMYSLKMLLAIEEATKKKAQVVKQQYHGPIVRLASRRRPALTQPAPPPIVANSSAQQAAASVSDPQAPASQQPQQTLQQAADVHMADAVGKGAAGTAGALPAADAASQPAVAAGAAAPEAGTATVGEGSLQTAAAGQDPSAAQDKGSAGVDANGDADKPAKQKDTTVYEATLVYELHNMHYPPLWLRRFRAPPPPAPALCLVTGKPAQYRDPETKVCFSSVATYQRIKGVPTPQQQPPPALAPLPLHKAPFNRNTCEFSGVPQRSTISAASQRALSAVPAELDAPPPPSLTFPMVQPNMLSGPLLALLVETANA